MTQTRITATQRFKVMACRECGEPVQCGSNTRHAPKCIDCTAKAVEESIRGMHDKAGPYYAKWRNAMSKAFADP